MEKATQDIDTYIYIHILYHIQYIYKVTCVCLDTSLFGNLHCWNSYTTTTEHVPSLSTTVSSSALGSADNQHSSCFT